MKTENAFLLGAAFLLLMQIPLFQGLFPEPYPAVLLPGGVTTYEHDKDTVQVRDWKIASFVGEDSTALPKDAIFPGSPTQYVRFMYSSIFEAGRNPELRREVAQWMRRNLPASRSSPQADSVCVYRVQKRIPLTRSVPEIDVLRSKCFTTDSG